MNPFLCIDLTSNKKNNESNGKEFLIATPSTATKTGYEQSLEQSAQVVKQMTLPLPLRIAKWISQVTATLLSLGLLRGVIEVGIVAAYHNAPVLFWIDGVALVLTAILVLVERLKTKKTLSVEENQYTLNKLYKSADSVFTELGVPQDAAYVDLLVFKYKTKNGVPKVTTRGIEYSKYHLSAFNTFADEENLYFANLDGKYAIPRSALKQISTVKKRVDVLVNDWSKNVGFNKGEYATYKMNASYGVLYIKPYHILEFDQNGEAWGIFFPCYERAQFERLTGLTAT